jgi:hypothetical protein
MRLLKYRLANRRVSIDQPVQFVILKSKYISANRGQVHAKGLIASRPRSTRVA